MRTVAHAGRCCRSGSLCTSPCMLQAAAESPEAGLTNDPALASKSLGHSILWKRGPPLRSWDLSRISFLGLDGQKCPSYCFSRREQKMDQNGGVGRGLSKLSHTGRVREELESEQKTEPTHTTREKAGHSPTILPTPNWTGQAQAFSLARCELECKWTGLWSAWTLTQQRGRTGPAPSTGMVRPGERGQGGDMHLLTAPTPLSIRTTGQRRSGPFCAWLNNYST